MKKIRDTFSSFHPIINFVFYLGALALGMVLLHPAFLTVSIFCAGIYYVTVRGRKALPFLGGMAGLFLVLSATNPFFNRYGNTVLFTYLGGLPYTLEALLYGMALGGMAVSVMLWFASFNRVMTSDKFMYLFGRMIPSLSMILTLVLRLLPNYQKKLVQLDTARRGIGMTADGGTVKEKLRSGMVIVSALTSWALEGGIVTADSMRSRGFGCGKRTSFSLCHFNRRDRALLVLMLFLLTGVLFCAALGGTAVSYTPRVDAAGLENGYTAAGTIFYLAFLMIPSAVNIKEDIVWRILRSKI